MKYLFTLQLPFEAPDDLAARHHAKRLIWAYLNGSEFDEATNKLQEVQDNKPPRKVEL